MENVRTKKNDESVRPLIEMGRMLNVKQVLEMWPVSREYLSRLTHHRDENKRLPAVFLANNRKPLYPFDKLMWYREKFLFEPKQKRKARNDERTNDD